MFDFGFEFGDLLDLVLIFYGILRKKEKLGTCCVEEEEPDKTRKKGGSR